MRANTCQGRGDLSHPHFGTASSEALRKAAKACAAEHVILVIMTWPITKMLQVPSLELEHQAEGLCVRAATSPMPHSIRYAKASTSSSRSSRSARLTMVSRRDQPSRLDLWSRKDRKSVV